MKMNKILIPIATFGLLVLSCSKSSSPAAVSPAVAQQTFSTVNTDVSAAVSGLNTAPGSVALSSFSNFTGTTGNPFGRIQTLHKPGDIKTMIGAGLVSIRQMILKGSGNERIQGGTAFDFASKKGIYIYNFDTKVFDKSPNTSDIIKIQYPKDTTSVSNDAELQITAYTEVSTPQGYNPTLIQAAIYIPIGGTKEVDLKLTAGYDSNGDPNKGSVDLFVNPYTISFSFDDSGATTATESFSFSKSGTVIIATNATATFASAADKTNGNPPIAVTGYVKLENVVFNFAVDGTKSSNEPNDFVTISVSIDGGAAGKVVFVQDPNDPNNEIPYIRYNDQTQTPLSTVFADLANQLNSLG